MNREFSAKGFVVFIVLVLGMVGFCFTQESFAAETDGLRILSIETSGNVSISRAKIISQVRARQGEIFDNTSADEDAKRIAKIEGVEYAYYNASIVDGQIKLIYVVVEKNLIRSIVFNGNEKFKDSKLLKETGLKKGDYLDTFIVRNSVKSIEELYHKKGYANVAISLDESQLQSGEVIYNITDGVRVKVKGIEFAGNEEIKDSELAKAIDTKKRKYIFWSGYFNKEVFAEDVIKLQKAYQKRGFLDVQISSSVKTNEDGKKAYITFTIVEGSIYYIDKVTINGNEFFDDAVLSEKMRLKAGGIYSREYGDFDARKIRSRYLEMGFVESFVEHRRLFSEKEKSVSVEYNVTEGERFRIGKISITGNHDVQDRVVRRVLEEEDFVPGQWYNADLARGDGTGELEKLVQRQVMTESTIIQPTGDAPGQRDAQVSIVEAQTGSIMLGAGVASNSGLVGQVVLDQRNFDIFDWPENFQEFLTGQAFKGAGQRFRISLNPGTEQSSFSISFTEPYLYDKPVSLDTAISSFERLQESYDEDRLKGYLGFEKRYKDDWRRGMSFRLENVDVSDIDLDAPKEVKADKGSNDLYGARLYIRKDTTDSRFLPSMGYNFNAGYEQVGGDHTFGVLTGTQRWYKTLYEDLAGRKTVLETKIHGGAIIGDAPVFEKFYAGGTGSIRGFDYRGVSTRGLQTNVVNPAYKDPIGSDWIVTGNAEIAFPITTEVLSWLVFVDAGAIDTGGLRASVGTGLQILLPQWFGPVPMRFELAVPFLKDDLDDTRVFSFTVGALF